MPLKQEPRLLLLAALILYLNRSVQPIQSREYATTFDEIRH